MQRLALTLLILAVSFAGIVLLQRFFNMQALAPMIFVMAVFLVSPDDADTRTASRRLFFGVLAVNFAFTFP